MELTVEIIEKLMKLMQTEKIDQLKIDTLHLVKTKFDQPAPTAATPPNMTSILDEEELLFHSTSAPALTPEMVEALAVNPPPKKKASKREKLNA